MKREKSSFWRALENHNGSRTSAVFLVYKEKTKKRAMALYLKYNYLICQREKAFPVQSGWDSLKQISEEFPL